VTNASHGLHMPESQNDSDIIVTICVRVCVYIEREKERRETADERQSHNYSDVVSESTNKRQAKTLKVMCFIDSKKITPSASS